MNKRHLTGDEAAALSKLLEEAGPAEVLGAVRAWVMRSLPDFSVADDMGRDIAKIIYRFVNKKN